MAVNTNVVPADKGVVKVAVLNTVKSENTEFAVPSTVMVQMILTPECITGEEHARVEVVDG